MSYLYTATAYATLIGLVYAAYHVSTQKANKRAAANPSRSARTTQNEPRKEDRKKKQRLESFVSETQEASKAKARVQAAEPALWPRPSLDDTSDDGADNREFAKQLAQAKEGKKFNNRAEGGKQKEKSVKQSKANQMTNGFADEKPSDTGAEADDDQSPIDSPEARPVDVSGVGDMLEPAPTGPSVLRITNMEKENDKPKVAKTPQKTETKKQRQNRKKAEAAKEAREEAEKERKTLEEKQRRTARIAEGRPAKDGSHFKAANITNSWSKGSPSGAGEKPVAGDEKSLHQPLDTFTKPAAEVQKPAPQKSEGSWISSLPSEEEQFEMLKDEADEWSTVQSKSSKKGKRTGESGDEMPKQLANKPKPAAPATKPTSKAGVSQGFGAFSALSDGAAKEEEDEEEEEWDV
jgi:hypothetical protein